MKRIVFLLLAVILWRRSRARVKGGLPWLGCPL